MNWSVPSFWQVWPGVCPWMIGAAGAVEQAAIRTGARKAILRIDAFLLGLNHPVHLKFPVLDAEGEPAFNQIDRVLPELLVSPARKDIQVFAHSSCESFKLVRAGDQPSGDAGLLGTDL